MLFAGWLAYHRAELWLKGSWGIPQGKSSLSVREEPIAVWTSTNILNKPKEFVNEWILKQQPKLIRRKPLARPPIERQVDYDRAKQLIQQIEQFLASGTHAPTIVNEYRQYGALLTAGCDRLDEMLEPISQAEERLKTNLSDQLEVEPFVRLWQVLYRPIPVIVDHDQSVSPTESQQKRREQTLQAIVERLGQIVETESERHQQLVTEADCGAYEVEIKRLLDQVGQVADLPPRHSSALQAALQAAKIKQNEIVEQRKVADCLSHIQRLYNNLSNNATQDEYHRVQAEIG